MGEFDQNRHVRALGEAVSVAAQLPSRFRAITEGSHRVPRALR